MEGRPIGIWLVTLFGILLALSMGTNIVENLISSHTGTSAYQSTGFVLASYIPMLITAFALSVFVFRLSRHAIWAWAAMVFALILPITFFALGYSNRAGSIDQTDTAAFNIHLRYGPLLFWAAVYGLIGVYLYQARKAGILK